MRNLYSLLEWRPCEVRCLINSELIRTSISLTKRDIMLISWEQSIYCRFLERTRTRLRADFLKTFATIPSRLHSLCGSGLEMITKNMDGVICISHGRSSVLSSSGLGGSWNYLNSGAFLSDNAAKLFEFSHYIKFLTTDFHQFR